MKYMSMPLLLMLATISMSAQKTALFNGKDLSGWNIHGTELWYVEDGLLVCESGPEKNMAISLPKSFTMTLYLH